MSAACITVDQIEARAATSAVLAIYARRMRDGFVAVTIGKPLLAFLFYRLNQLKNPLRHGALEGLSDEQLTEVAGLLKNLNVCLLRLAEDSELRSHKSLHGELKNIQDSIEDFESILENIYLSLDPGFHKAVSSAVASLRLGVEERATVLR